MTNSLGNNLPVRDLALSFASARTQKEHEKQQAVLHLKFLVSVGSRPAVLHWFVLQSNCHLYDCWPLVGRDE